MCECPEFHYNSPFENYMELLRSIYWQMDSDQCDYEQYGDTTKNYIIYYLEHMEDSIYYNNYLSKLFSIIPYEILEEKILSVKFGFSDTNDEDYNLYLELKDKLYEEIDYREKRCKCISIETITLNQCWYCEVRDCGCKADFRCCGSRD